MASSKVMYSPCIALICGFLASVAVLATAKPLDYGQLFSSAAGKNLSPRMSLAAALSSRPQFRQSVINNNNNNNYNQMAGADGAGSTYADRMEALYRDLLYGPYAREEAPVDLGERQFTAAAAEVPSMEQLQDLKQLLADYDAVYGNGNGNSNTDSDYFQSEQPVAMNGADAVQANYGDTVPAGNFLTEAREGTWLDGPVVPRVEYSTEDPIDDLLLNYFLQHYQDLTKGGAEDAAEDASELSDGADLENNLEKRRQKVVIKDEQQSAMVSSSTASPAHSTAAPSASISARKPKLGPLAKAKAATNNNNRRGQKEVALLRPAEAKPKQQPEWPSELDEKNLEEEEQSLKELSESMRAQSRPVRDVLTSQLDSLKTEAQAKSGAAAQGEQKQNN